MISARSTVIVKMWFVAVLNQPADRNVLSNNLGNRLYKKYITQKFSMQLF